jgi:hypothetical protein
MTKHIMKSAVVAADLVFFDNWFDPIEHDVANRDPHMLVIRWMSAEKHFRPKAFGARNLTNAMASDIDITLSRGDRSPESEIMPCRREPHRARASTVAVISLRGPCFS